MAGFLPLRVCFFRGVDAGPPAHFPPKNIANFVLMDYGSGAVMAVPAHDQRDWEFATQYGLNIDQVIKPVDETVASDTTQMAYTEKGLLVNSAPFDGLTSEAAFDAIAQHLIDAGLGEKQINYRLRDCLIGD
jgi:leucyl-tRNA synthetase